MPRLLRINAKLPLVQVWNKDPVALLVMQILCLPFDLVSNTPPFLYSMLVGVCFAYLTSASTSEREVFKHVVHAYMAETNRSRPARQ